MRFRLIWLCCMLPVLIPRSASDGVPELTTDYTSMAETFCPPGYGVSNLVVQKGLNEHNENDYRFRLKCIQFVGAQDRIGLCKTKYAIIIPHFDVDFSDDLKTCACNEYLAGIKTYPYELKENGVVIARERRLHLRCCTVMSSVHSLGSCQYTGMRYLLSPWDTELRAEPKKGTENGVIQSLMLFGNYIVAQTCVVSASNGEDTGTGCCGADGSTKAEPSQCNMMLRTPFQPFRMSSSVYRNHTNVVQVDDPSSGRQVAVCKDGHFLSTVHFWGTNEKDYVFDIECQPLTYHYCYCFWRPSCAGVEGKWYLAGWKSEWDSENRKRSIEFLCCTSPALKFGHCEPVSVNSKPTTPFTVSNPNPYGRRKRDVTKVIKDAKYWWDGNALQTTFDVCEVQVLEDNGCQEPCKSCDGAAGSDPICSPSLEPAVHPTPAISRTTAHPPSAKPPAPVTASSSTQNAPSSPVITEKPTTIPTTTPKVTPTPTTPELTKPPTTTPKPTTTAPTSTPNPPTTTVPTSTPKPTTVPPTTQAPTTTPTPTSTPKPPTTIPVPTTTPKPSTQPPTTTPAPTTTTRPTTTTPLPTTTPVPTTIPPTTTPVPTTTPSPSTTTPVPTTTPKRTTTPPTSTPVPTTTPLPTTIPPTTTTKATTPIPTTTPAPTTTPPTTPAPTLPPTTTPVPTTVPPTTTPQPTTPVPPIPPPTPPPPPIVVIPPVVLTTPPPPPPTTPRPTCSATRIDGGDFCRRKLFGGANVTLECQSHCYATDRGHYRGGSCIPDLNAPPRKAAQLTCQCLFDPCRNSAMDIVFLLDSSGSLEEWGFQQEIDFIRNFISRMTLGPTESRVGLVQFSTGAHKIFSLTDPVQTQDAVRNKLGSLIYDAGDTNITAGFYEAVPILATSQRIGVPQVVVLVTDGIHNQGRPPPTVPASQLRDQGVLIYAVGIGPEASRAHLSLITGDNSNVFMALFSDLNNVLNVIGAEVTATVNSRL